MRPAITFFNIQLSNLRNVSTKNKNKNRLYYCKNTYAMIL